MLIFRQFYTAESLKGILGRSDRMAAVKGVVEAAGGTVNMVSFARDPYDVVVDMNLPSHEMIIDAVAMVRASGLINDAIYIELIDGDPVWGTARLIAGAHKPANA